MIVEIPALFTSAISLYLPSMDVRRSMWLCLAAGLPGKECWDVRRCRPTRRSTRKIMRKRFLHFNRYGLKYGLAGYGFGFKTFWFCRYMFKNKCNTLWSILFSLVFLLFLKSGVRKLSKSTTVCLTKLWSIQVGGHEFVCECVLALVCTLNLWASIDQMLIVPTQILVLSHW